MHKVIKGNLEAIDQLSDFISHLSHDQYNYTHGTVLSSSIGHHLRHILDLYHSLFAGSNELIDYDARRRGAKLESDRLAGLAELASIRHQIEALPEAQIKESRTIKTEVMLSSTCSLEMESSLERELCFVSSHLTHHLAIMAALAKLAGCEIGNDVGLAPATASFVRTQESPEAA